MPELKTQILCTETEVSREISLKKSPICGNRDKFLRVSQALYRRHPSAISHCLFRTVELLCLGNVKIKGLTLDAGCGDGTAMGVFRNIFKVSSAFIGVDVSTGVLSIAKSQGVYEDLICADITHLPFRDGAFQTILSISVLEHIPGYSMAISEFKRVASSGTEIGISVVNAQTFSENFIIPKILKILKLRQRYSEYVQNHIRQNVHVVLNYTNDWIKALSDCSMKLKSMLRIWPKSFVLKTSLFAVIDYLTARLSKNIGHSILLPVFSYLENWQDEEGGETAALFVVMTKL